MVEITYNIFEDDFNRSQTHQYNLFVLLGTDRLSYLVINKEQKVLGLRSYRYAALVQPLQHLLKEDVILNSSYHQTRVGIFSKQFTLLPNELFESVATAKEYLSNLVALQQNDRVKVDTLASNDAKCVYATNRHVIEEVEACLPSAKIYHSATGLLQNFCTNFDKSTINIFLHIYNHTISLTVTDKGQLQFYNNFTFKASADCLYFVLLVYKQLGLQPQKVPLYVVGELVENSEIHQLLHKYIKTIKFVDFPNFYTFGSNLKEELPSNLFFDLYSLKLCE